MEHTSAQPASGPLPTRSRRLLSIEILTVVGILTLSLPLLGALGRFHWLPDLFTHFRVQYVVALIGVSTALAALRSFKPALCVFLCALILAAEPLGFLADRAEPSTSNLSLKLISHNVRSRTSRHTEVVEFLHRESPDVAFLMEIDQRWMNGLSALFSEFPHRIAMPREDNFGVLLLSKWPIETQTIHHLGDAAVPTIEAIIRFQNQNVHLFASHPVPPSGSVNSANRNAQLRELSGKIAKSTNACIVAAGDFNLTPYSSIYCDFQETSRLLNSCQGFGIRATWRRNFFPFAIPIDHVFHSPHMHTLDHRIGPNLGSDHSSLIVTLALPQK
jgi:endonuclease/exonuclease/phosphatase (EEP) superfamily protein YafD